MLTGEVQKELVINSSFQGIHESAAPWIVGMYVLVEGEYGTVRRLPPPRPLPDEQTIQRFLGDAQSVPDSPEPCWGNNFTDREAGEFATLQDQNREARVSNYRRCSRARRATANHHQVVGRANGNN